MKAFRDVLRGTLLALALGLSGGAAAVVITYQATDLPDLPGQGDRWQYSYKVSGNFVVGGGFIVLFSPTLYGKLEDPAPAVNPGWMLLVDQPNPDPAVLSDGLYTATAIVPNPSVVGLFTLTFDWLGSGSPGSQPFEVFDESFFPRIQVGQTQAVGGVPLPGTLGLLGLGLLALGARKAGSRSH